jgi:hypothetical protein
MINVVDEEMVGRVDYFTVHFHRNTLSADSIGSDGIEGIWALGDMPFVLIQSLEIVWVDDGVFALCKRYPAEGVAVAETAVK